ncbi:MAG: hypothetical protein COC00_012460 [Rhizobiales bacterium]|nr:hypothetical protein [Hyphomicrobiales bacterium]
MKNRKNKTMKIKEADFDFDSAVNACKKANDLEEAKSYYENEEYLDNVTSLTEKKN